MLRFDMSHLSEPHAHGHVLLLQPRCHRSGSVKVTFEKEGHKLTKVSAGPGLSGMQDCGVYWKFLPQQEYLLIR